MANSLNDLILELDYLPKPTFSEDRDMKKVNYLFFLMILAVSTLSAFIAKPANHTQLEIIPEKILPSRVEGHLRIETASGIPRTIYSPNYTVSPADPETMARQYLNENQALLRHFQCRLE